MNQAVKNNSSKNPMIIGIVVCCLVISIIMLFFAVRMDEEKPIEPTMEPIPEESSKESNEEPDVESDVESDEEPDEEFDEEFDEESDEEELIPPPPPPPPPSKVAMRYVWFGYDESDWTRPLNIREIEVYSGGVNIVKGFGNEAVESGSGFYDDMRSFPPEQLFDGSTNTHNFGHTNDAKTNYFKIDLGKDYSVIEKVVVTNRKDCCKDRWAGSYVKLLDNYGNLVKKSKETLSSDKVNAGLIDVQEFTFD